MIYNAKELSNPKDLIYSYLQSVDNNFIPSLSYKVKLDKYTDKILALANVYIAMEEDVIQGIIVFYTNNKEERKSYCALLSVSKKFRGLGISTALLEKFLEKSKEDGMITATCHTNNSVALAIYMHYGFIEKSREKSNIEDVMDRVFLEKML